jgi:YHS domain-containing protein
MRPSHPRRLALAALLAFGFTAGAARAANPVNETFFGIAVHGYDVVAYFDESRPVKGSREFRHEWQGTRWHFASAESRDRFRADPERYAPQYGGYCAYAVAQGATADIDPEAWKIVDGKLFMAWTKASRDKWLNNAAANIAKADQNWAKIKGQN